MNCPQCEDVCRCHTELSAPLPGNLLPDVLEEFASSEPVWGQPLLRQTQGGLSAVQSSEDRADFDPAVTTSGSVEGGSAAPSWTAEGDCPHITSQVSAPEVFAAEVTSPEVPEDSAWRGELSDRLRRYRSRRKMSPPRYPSLSLQFDTGEPRRRADLADSASSGFETVSDQALALNRMEHFPAEVADDAVPTDFHADFPANGECGPESASGSRAVTATAGQSAIKSSGPRSTRAKIIEFPHFAWGPPPPPPDQLAEPVMGRPRIIEVPEVAPPPPALGGITIEATQRHETEKRPGVDMPLRSAPLARRILAGMVDGLVVGVAAALFGFIFWKIAAVRPPMVQILGIAAGIPCLFWAVYQYLLIVYAGGTLGLRAAGLQLALFDGAMPARSLRRWRVLASYLSAASLGMGYAWVLLDEDSLCWHDRITHTYIAPKAAREKKQN